MQHKRPFKTSYRDDCIRVGHKEKGGKQEPLHIEENKTSTPPPQLSHGAGDTGVFNKGEDKGSQVEQR